MPLEKGQWVFPKGPSKVFNFGGWIVNGLVGTISQVGLKWLTHFRGYDLEILENAVAARPKGQPLITVSNHFSCLDDPMLWGCLKWKTVLNRKGMRMTPSGHDIIFTKKAHTIFFSLGKCVPIVRGDGVYQKGMDYCIDYANSGGWLHIFPEGKVNMAHEVLRLKWGVGRVIAECKVEPLVIPFWHVGMDEVLPNRTPYVPQFGKKVTVLVSKPVQLQDLLKQLRQENRTPVEIRKEITDAIQHEFISLRARAEALHYGHKKSTTADASDASLQKDRQNDISS